MMKIEKYEFLINDKIRITTTSIHDMLLALSGYYSIKPSAFILCYHKSMLAVGSDYIKIVTPVSNDYPFIFINKPRINRTNSKKDRFFYCTCGFVRDTTKVIKVHTHHKKRLCLTYANEYDGVIIKPIKLKIK